MKSQAGLEYLMTYGFAIIVLGIIGVALYSMNIFNPTTITSKKYSGLTEFTVIDWKAEPAYRRQITISDPNDLTDYQVPINISYNSNMNSDFSDLRFTWYNSSSGKEVDIPYWIGDKSDGKWAYVWVKVPEIPANGNSKVYVYYGSANTSSESNGEKTFINSKIYGSSGNDYFHSVYSDGKYIYAVGYTNSECSGGYDAIIYKFYPNLSVAARKVCGGSSDYHEKFYSVYSDGKYVYAVGQARYDDNDRYGLIIKFYPNLSIVESKKFQAYTFFNSVYSDGNYLYVAGGKYGGGFGYDDALIIKLYPNLSIVKSKIYGGSSNEIFYSVYSDSKYIYAVGYTGTPTSSTQYDAIIYKLYPNLSIVKSKIYGGNEQDFFYSVYSDSKYIYAVGYSNSIQCSGWFGWIVKFYPNLSVANKKVYRKSDNTNEYFYSIYSDGTYLYVVGGDGIYKLYPNLSIITEKMVPNSNFYSVYPFGKYIYAVGYNGSDKNGYNATIIKLINSLSMKSVYPSTQLLQDFSSYSCGASLTLSDSNFSIGNVTLTSWDNQQTLNDSKLNTSDIYFRKYTDPEPTYTIGNEEKIYNSLKKFTVELSPKGDPISNVKVNATFNGENINCISPSMMNPDKKYEIECELPNSVSLKSGDTYSLKLIISYIDAMSRLSHIESGSFSGKVE